jgi:hypothetical protein
MPTEAVVVVVIAVVAAAASLIVARTPRAPRNTHRGGRDETRETAASGADAAHDHASPSVSLHDSMFWSEAAEQAFAKARRKAGWERLRNRLGGRDYRLLRFEDVSRQGHLLPGGDQTSCTVPLASIVGSVGKPEQFTRSFRPASERLRDRWKMAYTTARVASGFRPVELYQVGDGYFVVDGHYRVSVARALGNRTIDARVRRWS